ncbi:DNA polymerase III subunit alpha [Agrobacterium rubi]|nr:DNA polymerase III subunit alpha [Agrobacterium rubi]NTF24271.1 DNA polymerase III subunit alpha [Agrobacterium rubi]
MSESLKPANPHVENKPEGAASVLPAGAFAQLHVHSDYSLSKGASKVKDMIARAAKLSIPAIALVDEANMYGAFQFSKYAADYGVQPIIGTKLWLALDDKGLKGSIILLAQNATGYANICAILSAAHRPHQGTKGGEGIIDDQVFEQHLEGVIALTGGRDGCLWRFLENSRDDDAEGLLDFLRFHFCDRLYVEVARTGDEDADEVAIEEKLIDMAYAAPDVVCADGVERRGVPLVAASEAWYSVESRNDAFEILKAVESDTKVKIGDDGVIAKSTRRFYLRTLDEMNALFEDIPQAVVNTGLIASRCAFKVEKRDPILPPFETDGGRSEAEELKAQSREGLEERFRVMRIPEEERETYRSRLEFELGIIEGMKFPGYFLIVSDFIKWAKAQGIPVGPGRGSGAGSLVAYALQITNINPLPHGLLFERFLNPERVSMPDFDIDFCQDRREEVIQYVVKKYGMDYVALIATFGEIKSKTALKDVGRVARSDEFGEYGFGEMDRLTKAIPMDKANPKPLKDAIKDKDQPLFAEIVESDRKYKVLFDNALKIEGLFRSNGSHAAGVLIAGVKLWEICAIGWDDKKQMGVSQFNMKDVEPAGAVKFDFLGLKTLSVLREALEHIKTTTGKDIDLDLLPLDDAETYAMLARGETNGIFQFESDGMKKWLQALKPDRFEDLVAMTSLYRPGPMDMIPHYVDCKNGAATPIYPEPVAETKPFLEETHGIMVYQEQVMLVAQKVAGYSLGQADLLRRAMGKKIQEEMDKERKKFVEDAVKLGRDAKAVDHLFDHIAKFAGYGFNKSHAAAYSLISYHTAYIKHHYPAQFFAAIMTYEIGTTDGPKRMAKFKEDMDALGIPMLLPDINRSNARFKPDEYQPGKFGVRLGLAAIQGISLDMPIMLEARAKAPFKSLEDFYKRSGSQFNKGQLEKLSEAGAFDLLAKNRASAANVLAFLSRGGRKTNPNQIDLFGGELDIAVPAATADIPEWGNRVDREFKAVGFYFGEHPLERYESKLRKIKVKRKASLIQWMKENGRAELTEKRLAGMVESYRSGISKKGNPYLVADLTEKNDSFTVWFSGERRKLEELQNVFRNATIARRPVVVLGRVVIRDNTSISIYGDEAYDAETLMAEERGRIRIIVDRDSVMPTADEAHKVRDAVARHDRGEISEDVLERVRAMTKMDGIRRKAGDINAAVARLRDETSPQAVEVIITLKIGDTETNIAMEGKYLIDQAAENTLKSIDGVVQISEEV